VASFKAMGLLIIFIKIGHFRRSHSKGDRQPISRWHSSTRYRN